MRTLSPPWPRAEKYLPWPGDRGVAMKRREFIKLVGGIAASCPFAARAQQTKKIPRIGVLWHAANAEQEGVYLTVVTKAFADLGYGDGKNIELEHRFPAEQPDKFRAFAREFVENKVDVILAVTSLGAREAKTSASAPDRPGGFGRSTRAGQVGNWRTAFTKRN